jgi:hypothetical protein
MPSKLVISNAPLVRSPTGSARLAHWKSKRTASTLAARKAACRLATAVQPLHLASPKADAKPGSLSLAEDASAVPLWRARERHRT